MTLAICTVNGNPIPTNGVTGANVGASSTFTIRLVDISEANSWSINCSMADGYNPLSTATLVNATKIQTGFTCTFVAPPLFDGYWGAAMQFTSSINNDPTTTSTFGVFVLCNNGLRMFFSGEGQESNIPYGVSYDLNAIAGRTGTGGSGGGGGGFVAGGDLTGSSTDQIVVGIQTNPVLFQSLTSSDDGYVFTWHNAGPYWEALPAPSGVTWANDLVNSSNSNQYVSSLSFDSNPAGGVIAINGTTTSLMFANSNTGPVLNQDIISSGNGATFTIQAQNATGVAHNGGSLNLTSGNSGSATAGNVNIQVAGSTKLQVSPTHITIPAFTSAGVVHNDTSGNLSSSLIVNADVSSSAAIAVSKLANGTADQLLDTNHAGTTAEWFTPTGDLTFASHNFTVVAIQGNSVTSGALVEGQFLIATSTSNWAATTMGGDITASSTNPGYTTVGQRKAFLFMGA